MIFRVQNLKIWGKISTFAAYKEGSSELGKITAEEEKIKAEFSEILWEFSKFLWEFWKIKGETFCEMRRNFLGEAHIEWGIEVDK